jgi:hypothetical protein
VTRAIKGSNALSEHTATDAIKWLLAFLQLDLPSLSQGDQLNLAEDVLRHLRPGGAKQHIAGTTLSSEDPVRRDVLLRNLQAALVNGINWMERLGYWEPFEERRVVDHGEAEAFIGGAAPGIWFVSGADGSIERYFKGELSAVLLARAADILMSWWPRLRRCKRQECGAFFLPNDRRQQFHDPKCSQKIRWHRFASTRVRDHHQEYARKFKGRAKPRRREQRKRR